jgi:hypothetical protein
MPGNRLDRSVDDESDHVLGPADAPITLVEYGSYACPYCRAANERIAEVRDQFGDRMRYVFRHRPLTGVEIARRAAELVERAPDPKRFWEEHIKLITRSETLTEDDLKAVARDLGVPVDCGPPEDPAVIRAKTRVDADEASAAASGALITPTFFINGRRYDGPWDESALADAMLGTLGHRVRSAALDFASWGPSAGVLLLLATIVAVALRTDTFSGRERLMAAIIAGLVVGKPVGILLASALAVATRLALKPEEYSWPQLAGAAALGGIGFTMSLFIAGEAFRSEADFEAAKIAVFIASVLSAIIGVTLLVLAARSVPATMRPLQDGGEAAR